MPYAANGYYNNPAIGQMAGSLASMFAPPTPQETLAAQTIKLKNDQQAKVNDILTTLPKSVADVYVLEGGDPAKMAQFQQNVVAASGAPITAQDPWAYAGTQDFGKTAASNLVKVIPKGSTLVAPAAIGAPYGFNTLAPPGADNSDDNSDGSTTATPAKAAAPVSGAPLGKAAGLLQPGNIDLNSRPVVRNPDGSVSTVRSMSIGVDGKEVLIPTVAADGSGVLSNQDAIDQFKRTGQHLGVFDTPANATAYANSLHNSQAARYAPVAAPGGPVGFAVPDDPSTKQMTPDQLGAQLEQAVIDKPGDPVAAANLQNHLKNFPRSSGMNVNVNGNPNGIEDGYNKAVGAQLAKVVDAGEETGSTRALYDQLLAASESGGDKITTGPMAQYALRAKQFIGNVLGTPLDGVPEAELMNNIGTTIAAKATRAMSQRGGTQFEFIKQLEAKPGFMQSRPGMEAIIKVAKQGLDDTDNLNVLAEDPYNRAHWPQIVKNYYATHPVMSPFFPGKPFSAADVAKIPDAASVPAPVETPTKLPAVPNLVGTVGSTLTPFNANGGSPAAPGYGVSEFGGEAAPLSAPITVPGVGVVTRIK